MTEQKTSVEVLEALLRTSIGTKTQGEIVHVAYDSRQIDKKSIEQAVSNVESDGYMNYQNE